MIRSVWWKALNGTVSYKAFPALEFVLVLAAIALAFFAPQFGSRQFQVLESRFARIAQRHRIAVLLSALFPLVLRLSLLPVLGIPEPEIQEEFSYLLSGDTFASGRLANPPHPMATYLETFQVLQRPTYSSIRPPGQGLFLALGQVLFGLPWAGVCISVALMSAALCWMLQGWLTPELALLGGLLAGLRLGVFSFWMNSYWGGAVAALGGMLVLGAFPRIRQRLRLQDVVWMALGIAFLVTTRAYEALFILLPVAGALLLCIIRDRAFHFSTWLRRFLLPMALLLGLLAGWLGYFNWRVTGNPGVAPYALGRALYNTTPAFVWQKLPPQPTYNHELMRQFFVGWELGIYKRVHTVAGYREDLLWRAKEFWKFYIGPALTLPLLVILPWLFLFRRMRFFLAIALTTLIGTLVTHWGPPYYFAPVTGVIFLLALEGLARLRLWAPAGRPVGQLLARSIPVICVGTFLCIAAAHLMGVRITKDSFGWSSSESLLLDRARVLKQLEQTEGQHLAIVQYEPGHSPHLEWVFNGADIDHAKVVWARDMGPEKNQALIRYFRGRRVWLVRPDVKSDVLIPFPFLNSPQQAGLSRSGPDLKRKLIE